MTEQPRWLPVLVLLAVFLAYLPSLSGGWVWDDHWLAQSGAVSLRDALTRDVWGGADAADSNLYRPLPMLLHSLGLGVLAERLLSLVLHLLAVFAVGSLGLQLGAGRFAWLGAAFFGLHPGTSECVAWVTGRHDLLPALLVLGGWVALLRDRMLVSTVLFGLAPFAKEPYVLVPLLPLLWGPRRSWKVSAGAALGLLLYLGLRQMLALPMPADAAMIEPFAPLGALARRGVELLLVPATADALPLFQPSFWMGVLAVIGGILVLALCRPLPWFRLLGGAGLLLLPCAPAAAHIGLVADRYFYLLFAVIGVGIGLLLKGLELRGGGRLLPFAWLLPLLLAPMLLLRAQAWESDASLFGASLALNPENPYAAFHVAHDLQVRMHDCKAAIPLYQRALEVDPRAVTNLQACLLEEGRLEEGLALISKVDPLSFSGALNTARILGRLQRWPEAREEARRATGLEPQQARGWALLAGTALRAGDLELAQKSASEAEKWLREEDPLWVRELVATVRKEVPRP